MQLSSAGQDLIKLRGTLTEDFRGQKNAPVSCHDVMESGLTVLLRCRMQNHHFRFLGMPSSSSLSLQSF